MTTPAQHRALKLSAKIVADEVLAQRKLGADWFEAYTRAWAIGDDAYNLILDSHDKPAVHLSPRTITGKMKL